LQTSSSCRAAWQVAQIPHHRFASYKESKIIYIVAAAILAREKMQLETERLILCSFRKEDVDVMAQLFANPDFMRFSLGVFTERKQTIAFIEKVIGWDHAGIPSQFAVTPREEDTIIGYCGFFYHPEHGIDDIEVGYRLHPGYWNRGPLLKPRALSVITAFATGGYRA
jgi:RimJ/RimL family protein N-acetyltransferase